jgi:uncharacterized protein
MGKLLFFLLLAVAIYWWLRRSQSDRNEQSRDPKIEAIVKCAYCGLHVPQSESVFDRGHYYCDEKHRRLGAESRHD